jgi:hypothetical protein
MTNTREFRLHTATKFSTDAPRSAVYSDHRENMLMPVFSFSAGHHFIEKSDVRVMYSLGLELRRVPVK